MGTYSAYGPFTKHTKRTQTDKVLKYKAFEIASNPKYDGYQRGLASMVYKFFNSKSKGAGIKNRIKENQGEFNSGNLRSKLANDLHNAIIRKFKRIKVYSSFKDNIWGVDLADMQLIKK